MDDSIASILTNPAEVLATRCPEGTALIPIFHYPQGVHHRKKGSVPQVVAFSLIDRIDSEQVMAFRWFLFHPKPHLSYAMRCVKLNGYTVSIFLHRFLLGLAPSRTPQVDHQNRIGLDNRRENLRITTQAENLQNQRKRANCSSKYRGVHWHQKFQRWIGYMNVKGKLIDKRSFKTEEEAAAFARNLRLEHMPFTEEDI